MARSATWIPGIFLKLEPGNGTCYRLRLVQDPDGGWLVSWPDGCWFGLFLPGRWPELRKYAGPIGKCDHDTILAELARLDLDRTCRTLAADRNEDCAYRKGKIHFSEKNERAEPWCECQEEPSGDYPDGNDTRGTEDMDY